MDRKEFELLKNIEEIKNLITINQLNDKSDRTLFYGYNVDRSDWHVYIKNKKIYSVVYFDHPEYILIKTNEDYLPSKRLYPERCDFEFCKLLLEKGLILPFTAWTDNIEKRKYYGKIL